MSFEEKKSEHQDGSWAWHAENRIATPQFPRRLNQNPSERQYVPIDLNDRDAQGNRKKVASGSVGASTVPALREVMEALARSDAFSDGDSYKKLIADVQQNPGTIVPYAVKVAYDAKPSNTFGAIFVLDAPSGKFRVELVRGLVGEPPQVRVKLIGKSTINRPSIHVLNELREMESLVADVDNQLNAWFGGKGELENLENTAAKNDKLQTATAFLGLGKAGKRETRINNIYWNRAAIEIGNCKNGLKPLIKDRENESAIDLWRKLPDALTKLRDDENLTALLKHARDNLLLVPSAGMNAPQDLSSSLSLLKMSLRNLSQGAFNARDGLVCLAGESNAAVDLEKRITDLLLYFDSVENNWR